jgi:hypothetical protein
MQKTALLQNFKTDQNVDCYSFFKEGVLMQAKMPTTVFAEIRAAKCRTIASYQSYAEAEGALDYLIDHGFREQSLAIVLTQIPQDQAPTHQSNWVFSSGQTALNGAAIGLGVSFLALTLSMFTPLNSNQPSIDLAFSGVIYGSLVGIVIGLMTWVFHQKRPHADATNATPVEHFNVIAQSADATRAEQVLFSLLEPAARA